MIAAAMLMSAVMQNSRYEAVNQRRAKDAGRTDREQLLHDTNALLGEIDATVNRRP